MRLKNKLLIVRTRGYSVKPFEGEEVLCLLFVEKQSEMQASFHAFQFNEAMSLLLGSGLFIKESVYVGGQTQCNRPQREQHRQSYPAENNLLSPLDPNSHCKLASRASTLLPHFSISANL